MKTHTLDEICKSFNIKKKVAEKIAENNQHLVETIFLGKSPKDKSDVYVTVVSNDNISTFLDKCADDINPADALENEYTYSDEQYELPFFD